MIKVRLKYLYRRPKSATEVMNIIKEAYDAFHEQQDINKKVKDKYEQDLFAKGIFEGTQVRVTSRSDIQGHVGIVKSINFLPFI